MKTARIAAALLCLGLANSCSTGSGGINALNSKPRSPDLATVVLIRKKQMTGAAGKVDVALDANKMGRIGSGECFVFQVPPGKHFVSLPLKTPFGLVEEVEGFDAKAGGSYYFFYSMSIGNDMYKLEQYSKEAAEKELARKNYRITSL